MVRTRSQRKRVQQTVSSSTAQTRPQRIIYYDFETTGFNPYHHEVIEIGAIDNDNRTFSKFLLTRSGTVPSKITEVTGITTDLLAREGIAPEDAFQQFLEWIDLCQETHDVVIIAHNNDGFDELFFRQHAKKFGLSWIQSKYTFVDSLRLAQFILPTLYSHRQQHLLKHFNIINTAAHRAIADCTCLKRLVRILQSLFYRQFHTRDLLHIKKVILS